MEKDFTYKELIEKLDADKGYFIGSTAKLFYTEFENALKELKESEGNFAMRAIHEFAAARKYGEIYGYISGLATMDYISADEMQALIEEIKHMREEALK